MQAALIVFVAGAALTPAFAFGPVPADSMPYTLSWTAQIGEAMRGGELWPRWLPHSFDELGAPTFYFYPPLALLLSGALAALGLTTSAAVNIAAFLLLAGSGLSMRAWLAARAARPTLGAALYMLAPYHLADFYAHGDLAEFGAYIWLPLITLGVERLPSWRAVPLLSAAWAGLILTHLPVAVLATTFLVAPLAVARLVSDRRALLPGGAAAVLGLASATAYLLPALTLQPFVNFDLLWRHGFSPERSLANLVSGGVDGWVRLLSVPVACGLLALRGPAKWRVIVLLASLAFVGVLPVWQLPILRNVQFPWRLGVVLEFAAITAFAGGPSPRPVLLALAAAAALQTYWHIGLDEQLAAARARSFRSGPAQVVEAPEYLPAGADVSGIGPGNRTPDLVQLERRATAPARDQFLVAHAGRVVLARAAFPIWRIEHEGRPVGSAPGPLVSFDAPAPGVYRLVRVAPAVEILGDAISLGGAAVLALLALWCVLGRPSPPAS